MPETRFRKNDRVSFRLGLRRMEGIVKEDRGPIGVKGRHLYLVEFRREPQTVSRIELPAVEMEMVDEPTPAG